VYKAHSPSCTERRATVLQDYKRATIFIHIQDDTKKRELLRNATKIKEIQEKKLLTKIEPLQIAF